MGMGGLVLVPGSFGQTGPAVQIVVTAEPRHEGSVPALTQKDVTVSSGKDHLDVLDLAPAQGDHAQLQLFLLMDESSSTRIGTEFPALKKFINDLPPTTAIAIGYMRNGTVDRVQDFTTDHATATAKLRLPMGAPGVDSSPYFSLSDLIRHWGGNGPSPDVRREILMISDGVDRFYGAGPDDPYVQTADVQAQRAGIVFSSIYWESVGHFGHSWRFINWGQSYLAQLAEDTGGEAYWQGIGNPVSFSPFLDEFANRLNNQYFLAFRAKAHNKAGLEPVKIRTEIRDVDLVGASAVWVP
jgi:hypothetical protein